MRRGLDITNDGYFPHCLPSLKAHSYYHLVLAASFL